MKNKLKTLAALGGVVLLTLSGTQVASANESEDGSAGWSVLTEESWQTPYEVSEAALEASFYESTDDAPEVSSEELNTLENEGLLPTPDDTLAESLDKIDALAEVGTLATNGTWFPVSASWSPASSWHCGATENNGTLAVAACVVRVGPVAQPAMVVQNMKPYTVNNVSTIQRFYAGTSSTLVRFGGCQSAFFVANGRAACSIPGGNHGPVWTSASAYISGGSPAVTAYTPTNNPY